MYAMSPGKPPVGMDNKTQANLIKVESIPKYSPMPPHTPDIFLSVSDKNNLFIILPPFHC